MRVLSFRSDRFDPSNETPNEFNPIAGQNVLIWIKEMLVVCGYESTEPKSEDWAGILMSQRIVIGT